MTAAPDTRITLTLDAPAGAVYAALVEPAGLRGWWSTAADVSTDVGGTIRFPWSETDFTSFRVDRLDAPSAVDWTCVAQRDGHLPTPEEWVGTSVSFRLTPEGETTRLDFVHHGLAALECGDMCARGWDFFLRRSLRALVETGTGLPWDP